MYRGLQELFEKASQAAYAAEDDGLTPSSSGTQVRSVHHRKLGLPSTVGEATHCCCLFRKSSTADVHTHLLLTDCLPPPPPSPLNVQANAMDGSPGDGRAQQAKQRAQEAARAVLKDGLAKLGPAAVAYVQQRQEAVAGGQTGVGALAVHELFSLARPLQEV